MYAKILNPGPPLAVPYLVGTTSVMDQLLPQLLVHHWTPYGSEDTSAQPPDGVLNLTVDQRLQLVVGGQAILDGVNPIAPPGWWEATEHIGKRCMAIVLRSSDADLTRPDLGRVIRRLMDEPHTGAWALLPIEHQDPRPTRPTWGRRP